MLGDRPSEGSSNAPYILISYAHEDAREARKLERCIKHAGVGCFRDERDIDFGEDIVRRVTEGVEKCSHVLVYVSPASAKSQWVAYEIGMACGRHLTVIPYLSHPSMDVPGFIRSLKYMNSVSQLTAFLQRLAPPRSDDLRERMSPVEYEARDVLYYHRYPYGYARAIRLFGADDEYVTEDRLDIRYAHTELFIPAELADRKNQYVAAKQADAEKRGAPLFNGPNTRLVNWRATPKDGPDVALERKTLELELGPVGWYDYEGLNEAVKTILSQSELVPVYEHYIGLSQLIANGDVTGSILSNILDTATAIVSNDGFVAYQERSENVSVCPGFLTSAVAENINRYLDDTQPGGSSILVNPAGDREGVDGSKDGSYRPRGVPHPFAAVRRGVAEELSPHLLPHIDRLNLKLTGMSFDLEALHPDALFILCLNLTKDEIVSICTAHPGKDWREGKLHFAKADFGNEDTGLAATG